MTAYNGTLSFFNRAPHPNAAKVAVNWLLSREGQTTWLDYNQKTGGLYDSLREDISKEKVSERARASKELNFYGSIPNGSKSSMRFAISSKRRWRTREDKTESMELWE